MASLLRTISSIKCSSSWLTPTGVAANLLNHQQTRGAKKWYPDEEWLKQWHSPLMWPQQPQWNYPLQVLIINILLIY